MTEKEIIERLILDIDCMISSYDININSEDLIMYNQLIESRRYKVYPELINQTSIEKEEIRILSNKTLSDD